MLKLIVHVVFDLICLSTSTTIPSAKRGAKSASNVTDGFLECAAEGLAHLQFSNYSTPEWAVIAVNGVPAIGRNNTGSSSTDFPRMRIKAINQVRTTLVWTETPSRGEPWSPPQEIPLHSLAGGYLTFTLHELTLSLDKAFESLRAPNWWDDPTTITKYNLTSPRKDHFSIVSLVNLEQDEAGEAGLCWIIDYFGKGEASNWNVWVESGLPYYVSFRGSNHDELDSVILLGYGVEPSALVYDPGSKASLTGQDR